MPNGEPLKKCPRCGRRPDSLKTAMDDHHMSSLARKGAKANSLLDGVVTATYYAKRLGLIPSKCPSCGTAYWIGGAL